MEFFKETGIFNFKNLKNRSVFDKKLANEILKIFPPQDGADLGCATGLYVDFLNKHGWNVIGYEGGDVDKNDIIKLDLSIPQKNLKSYPFILFLEVGEHIPKNKEPILLDNICKMANDILIVSWANSSQKGKGHVNCKNRDEVIKIFENRNFKEIKKLSQQLRENSKKRWFRNNIIVFKKR